MFRSHPFRSLADSICKSKLHDKGRKNVPTRAESSHTFATSTSSKLNSEDAYDSRSGVDGIMSLQGQIINALYLGERDKASSLLSNLSRQNVCLRTNDFNNILDYCARTPDPLFVLETWRVMEESKIGTNKRCRLFIVQALTKAGYLKEAFKWLYSLEGTDYTDLPMYNAFLNGCARMKSKAHADSCLDLMEERLIGKSEVTYYELLKLAALDNNLSAVHEVWKEYTKYYSPSLISLRKFILHVARLEDLASACKALQHMVILALEGSSTVFKSSKGKFTSSRLDIPIPYCSSSPATTIRSNFCIQNQETQCDGLKMLKSDPGTINSMKLLRWSFSNVIHACAHARESYLAEQLLQQMHNLGLEPSSYAYDGVVRAIVYHRGVADVKEVVREMDNLNMKPHSNTISILSIGCSKELDLDLAEDLLNNLVETQNPHAFNVLLAACDVMEQPERAIRVLAKLKELKLKPDIETYELLFSLFGNVNGPYPRGSMPSRVDTLKRLSLLEMDMVNNGVVHSPRSRRNVLKALGAEGMIEELLHYLSKLEKDVYFSNTPIATDICNKVLQSLVKTKESYRAIDMFKEMKLHNTPLDAATYNIMIDCCYNISCVMSAVSLLSLMLRDGFVPQKHAYTALIKVYAQNQDYLEVLSILDRASIDGIQPDVLLYNTILLEAFMKPRIDIIEHFVERMHQEKIQPDPSTCCYVFSAYLKTGSQSTAVEALQVLSMRMISEDNTVLQENRSSYEDDYILNEDPDSESRIIDLFRDSQENLAAAMLNLRWCARIGFPISWLPNETYWARGLSSLYLQFAKRGK